MLRQDQMDPCLWATQTRSFMPVGAVKTVHHLNCGSFTPWRGLSLVTHVLLCEMEHGLLLVDVGTGIDDAFSPTFRLGHSPRFAGAHLAPGESALHQLKKLGFASSDVTDIVTTHLDYDHVGGLADFPSARLHTTATELIEARKPVLTRGGRIRYRPAHTETIRNAVTYSLFNDTVLGLKAAEVSGTSGVFLAPTPGHTIGHAAVAVLDPVRGWLVHAGDAFLNQASIHPHTPKRLSNYAIQAVEMLLATDRAQVRKNHSQFRDLAASGVRVFCSHDAAQLEALQKETHLVASV
ncbi:hypothetical protein CH282_15795 [Rhodococcus sp. 06-418-1B]|nr:hypothetical protein CH282_15795 [Rhodococcus sp. 06-418-1B]